MNKLLSGRRVLVVEDEMVVAWMLGDMLTNLGCTVVGPVAWLEKALALIETAVTFDVALLDINLNGQKSYPVADVLVARSIPFVFATGYNKDSLLEAYQKFPILQKPYSESELSDTLVKLLMPVEREHLSSLLLTSPLYS